VRRSSGDHFLGTVQIAVALTVNLLIVLAAGTIAVFLSGRPSGCASSDT
jgi:hypothetical protein